MTTKVRVNLANSAELLELPGVGPKEADAILKFRAEHGPIKDEHQLVSILGGRPVPKALSDRADFSPADSTAPEAPGA
jgi:competence ComEA-like helix-hairpin-helix protein